MHIWNVRMQSEAEGLDVREATAAGGKGRTQMCWQFGIRLLLAAAEWQNCCVALVEARI